MRVPLLKFRKSFPEQAFTPIRWRRRGQLVTLHAHDFPEIFWVTEGRICHRVNGRDFLLSPGDLVLIRPSDAHSMTSEIDSGWTNLAFERSSLDFLRRRYFSGVPGFYGGQAEYPAVISLRPEPFSWLSRAFDRLERGPWTRLELERFLLNLIDRLDFEPSPKTPVVPDWLARAIESLDDMALAVEGVAAFTRVAARSPEHVAREVRRCCICTPTDLVNRARLRHAAQRLTTSSKEIADIAYECGFDSIPHFYKLFRRQFAATPRQFRAAGFAPE